MAKHIFKLILLFGGICLAQAAISSRAYAATEDGTKANPFSVSDTSYSGITTQLQNAHQNSLRHQRIYVEKSTSTDLGIVAQNAINEVRLTKELMRSYNVYHTPLIKYKIGQDDGVWYIDYNMLQLDDPERTALAINNRSEIMTSFSLSGKTQYQKVKTIHDYIVANIKIDYTYTDSTFDAINTKRANLEQIPYLFQYFAGNTNIQSRVITGNLIDVNNVPHRHVWNIVKIGSYWYNLDPIPYMISQLSDSPATCYKYFLENNEDFTFHERDEEFNTEEYNTSYVMTPKTYNAGSTKPKPTDPTCIYPEIKNF